MIDPRDPESAAHTTSRAEDGGNGNAAPMNRGRLRHGNPPGDFLTSPRCGARARTRGGEPCRAPAVRGKARCRMHGGKSTGPRTKAGLARSARARWTHGGYSIEAHRQYVRLKMTYRRLTATIGADHALVYAAARQLLRAQVHDLRNVRRREKRRQARGGGAFAPWSSGRGRHDGRSP